MSPSSNGYRDRSWQTRFGTIELKIAKLESMRPNLSTTFVTVMITIY